MLRILAMGVATHQKLCVTTMELHSQVDAGALQAHRIMHKVDAIKLRGKRSDDFRRPIGAAAVRNYYFDVFVQTVPGKASDNGSNVERLIQHRDDDQDFSRHDSAAVCGCSVNPLVGAVMFFCVVTVSRKNGQLVAF